MESLDELFELLQKERRRYALYYLEQHDHPVAVEEIIAQVTRWEADTADPEVLNEKYDRLEIALTHTDLPKLSEEPYIRYNRETGYIELTNPPPAYKAIIAIAQVIERTHDEPTDVLEE